MTVSVHEHMHHDHRAWRAEVDQWCDDIELWEKEVHQAESRLRDLEQALRAHREALSAHKAAIQNRKQSSDKHEAAIAAWESVTLVQSFPPWLLRMSRSRRLRKPIETRTREFAAIIIRSSRIGLC